MVFLSAASLSFAAGELDRALEITEDNCRALMARHRTLSADYQGGVDVYGRRVVGADVAGESVIKLPDIITIPIRFDFAAKYDLPEGIDATTLLGEVVIKKGKAYWNGQALNPEDEKTVVRHCENQLDIE